jgi:hypothetical protein
VGVEPSSVHSGGDVEGYLRPYLEMGMPSSSKNQPMFKFELGWPLGDGFMEMVRNVWDSVKDEEESMRYWQSKIRRLHQHLKGWVKHTSGIIKKEKKDLLDKLDSLDKKAKYTLLSPQELDLKQCMSSHLSHLLREEEIKWYQRSKANHLLEGDANTKYFHLLANGRHRKTRIFQLQDGDNIIRGDNELKKHITSYYKGLFGRPFENLMQLVESLTDDIPQVTAEENRILVEEFTEEEVRKAVFQMEHNKASDPMVFR